MIFGEKHMNHLKSEFLKHYMAERPNKDSGTRGSSNLSPLKGRFHPANLRCTERLGGVFKHYHRKRRVGVRTVPTQKVRRYRTDALRVLTRPPTRPKIDPTLI